MKQWMGCGLHMKVIVNLFILHYYKPFMETNDCQVTLVAHDAMFTQVLMYGAVANCDGKHCLNTKIMCCMPGACTQMWGGHLFLEGNIT